MVPASISPRLRLLLYMAAVTLLVSPACQFLANLRTPKVENHPQPTLSVSDAAAFADTGCTELYGAYRCPPESLLGQLGCSLIRPTGDLLGGLQPAYPLQVCLEFNPESLPADQYIYTDGCLTREYVRYVFAKGGEYHLIKNKDELRQTFAPINSENEALSFAIAVTGLAARYDLDPQPGLRYFVDQLEDTYVAPVASGYRVHLFDYRLCGCGPHTHYFVDVLVTPEGQVSVLEQQPIYEDPAEDGLCVD